MKKKICNIFATFIILVWMIYIVWNFDNLNEKESAVVAAYLGVDCVEQPFEVIADYFGDFFW